MSEPEVKKIIHSHEPYNSVEVHRSAKGVYYWTIKVIHAEAVRVSILIDSFDQELRQKYGGKVE